MLLQMDSVDLVEALSKNMQNMAPPDYVTGEYLLEEYNPEVNIHAHPVKICHVHIQ